jgi:hypothetical protein
MNFAKNLIGGMVIMVVATLVGVAQNAVRSDTINLFPKIQKPTPRGIDAPENPSAGQVQPAARSAVGETDQSGEVTDEELAAGEVFKERLRIIMEAGNAIVIDARGEGEFAEGHLAGALNIPYEQFIDYHHNLVSQVPMDATVIVYCS